MEVLTIIAFALSATALILAIINMKHKIDLWDNIDNLERECSCASKQAAPENNAAIRSEERERCINEACEWLIQNRHIMFTIDTHGFVNIFRKAMEGENNSNKNTIC